jgi:hypothetical protein
MRRLNGALHDDRRRGGARAAAIALLGTLVLTACGGSGGAPSLTTAQDGTGLQITFPGSAQMSTPVVGQVLTPSSSGGVAVSHGARWQSCASSAGHCTRIAAAPSGTYTVASGDVGRVIRVRADGETATTGAVGGVGAPGPAAGCSTTVRPGTNLQLELARANAGDVVCLAAGSYGDVELSGISHSSAVTLAPVPGATVHLGALVFVGPKTTSNLTVQGLYIDGGVAVRIGTPHGLVFQYDTIHDIPRGFAYYFYANGSSAGSYTQSGVKVLYNQIDHVGACLEVDGGRSLASDFTFSHNVCGPGIGAGATVATEASHYVQIGGVTGATVDDNAFLGPMDPNYITAGLHNNVLHVFGSSSGIDFSGNLMWHTQSRGQTLLLEEGQLDDVTIANNLDVEDPRCDSAGQCSAYAVFVDDAHGLRVQHNTIVDSYYGVLLTRGGGVGYPDGRGYDVSRNVIVSARTGSANLSYQNCSAQCAVGYNVTGDRSAHQRGGTQALAHWAPRWGSTAWEPTIPFAGPPPSYRRAIGLPWDAGYQGLVGP